MKCDFRNTELTAQALFKCKLSGEPIHFGYIPVWQLPAFVRFCKKNKLIEQHPEDQRDAWFTCNHYFLYTVTHVNNDTIFGTIHMWLADLLRMRLYTRRSTINCGGGGIHPKWRYVIRSGRYIA